MREWSAVMIERMKELKPLVACFNGKGIYEIFSGGKCIVGVQPNPLPGTDTVRPYSTLVTYRLNIWPMHKLYEKPHISIHVASYIVEICKCTCA